MPRGCDDYIILIEFCQIGAVVEESDVVAGVCKHFVEWGADEFAAADEGDFDTIERNIVAG